MTKKQVKDSARPGVPRPKKVGSGSAGVSVAKRDPLRGPSDPSREEKKAVGAIMLPFLKHMRIVEDIDWSYFALGQLKEAKNMSGVDMRANAMYHMRRIIKGKKKLGYDTSADERWLEELRARTIVLATGIGADAKRVRSAAKDGTRAKPGSAKRKSPKPRKQIGHAH